MSKTAKVTSAVTVQADVFNHISPNLLPIIHDFCSAYKIPRHEIMDYLISEGLRKTIKSDYGLVEELSDYYVLNRIESSNNFHDALEERLGEDYGKTNWFQLSKRDF
jgi:hypothetical protein